MTEVLYPVVPQSIFARCLYCYQPASDIAVCEDPRDGDLRRLCGRCYRALAAGQRITLTEAELTEAWTWLARQHINQKAAENDGAPLEETGVTDVVIDAALTDLALHLNPFSGRLALEDLEDALLRLQDAEDPATVLDREVTGPEFDAETYVNHLRGCVDDAVHKLIGRTAT